MLWSCKYQGDLTLAFIDVKRIQAVVTMVSHILVLEGQEAWGRFFLVEKPGLDITVMAGTEEDFTKEDTNGHLDLAV